MAGAHDDKVALANLDALGGGAGVELGRADRIAVRQRVEALEASDVEQDAAADHLVADMLDPELLRALRADQLGVVAVVHLVVEEDVAKRVPLRRGLAGHVDRVVGVAQVGEGYVLIAGRGVGPCRQHGVNGIPAAAEQTGLDRLFQR